MGIRESLKNRPDQEKLQNFVIEEESKSDIEFEPEFDVKKEIPEKYWQIIFTARVHQARKEALQNNEWSNFIFRAARIKIVNPEKIPELNLNHEVWQGGKSGKQGLEKVRQKKFWVRFSKQALEMKILFPDKASELNLNEEAWQGMKNDLEDFRQRARSDEKLWENFSGHAMAMKILFPNKVSELNLDEEAWQGIKQQLEIWRKAKLAIHNNVVVEDDKFPELAIAMKILFPNRFSELKIDKKLWKKMRQELKAYEDNWCWDDCLSAAMAMKILAAKRIEIGDFELTMPEKKTPAKPVPPRPERLEK